MINRSSLDKFWYKHSLKKQLEIKLINFFYKLKKLRLLDFEKDKRKNFLKKIDIHKLILSY